MKKLTFIESIKTSYKLSKEYKGLTSKPEVYKAWMTWNDIFLMTKFAIGTLTVIAIVKLLVMLTH